MGVELPKRFWTATQATKTAEGYSVELDGRALKTPAKADLVVPTRGLAQAVAQEWDALEEKIDPTLLPFTKLCNAAIDNMVQKAGLVVETLAEYAETDLLCYRADSPEGLKRRQSEVWDPLLDWARDSHGLFFVQTAGILPVEQPPATLSAFHKWLSQMDHFQLMACHDLIMGSGSIVISRAVVEGHIDANTGWAASIVDEIWQMEQWGDDEEAKILRDTKARDFKTAAQMIRLLHKSEGSASNTG